MQEGYSFAFRTQPGCLVDEPNAGRTAARKRTVEVVHGEADVVNSGAAPGHELPDGRVIRLGLEQFHQRLSGGKASNGCPVGVVQRYLGHAEHVTVQGQQRIQCRDGNADVRDSGSARSWHGLFRSVHDGFYDRHGGGTLPFGASLRADSPLADDPILILYSTRWLSGCPAGATEHTMANAVEVKDDTFATEIEGHKGLAVVDFWATWCAPCRMIAPIVEQLAADYAGKAKVAKLDVDNNQKTAAKFNVRSIPTILFFKDGKLVDTVVGAVPRPALEAKFKEHA